MNDSTRAKLEAHPDDAAKRTPVEWPLISPSKYVSQCAEQCCTVPPDHTSSHTVPESHARPLDKFNTRKELIHALYDAVNSNGHWGVWKKKIPHRDIRTKDILRGVDSAALDVGVLIDLDRSRDHRSWRTGTRAFQSINVIEDVLWCHDHQDDLESFFYVLCWICHSYSSAHHRLKDLPAFLRAWEDGTDDTVAAVKYRFLTDTYQDHLASAWFGRVFRRLMRKLAEFCAERYRAKRRTVFLSLKIHKPEEREEALRKIRAYDVGELGKDVPSAVSGKTASEDYAEFLGIVRSAIDELGDGPDDPPASG
ncbi:hypothetical protein PLICRDRAFT_33300 [Plicaturopsis crispa FD-325 SS-3]|nr:hypothetical protein PLICRDRAFT_33300 [Plicaturopsis crispa FD-325 SS-3]